MSYRTVLLSAALVVSVIGCERGGEAPANTEQGVDAVGAGNVNQAAQEAVEPTDCTATEGVSSGPFCGFKAVHNVQPIITQPSLRVYGQYRLAQRTGSAALDQATPQGINENILLVNLTISTTGSGGHWYSVEQRFNASQGQYTQVTVTDATGAKIDIPVEEVH